MSHEVASIFSARAIPTRNGIVNMPYSLSYFSGEGSNYPPEYINPHSEYRHRFQDMSLWIAQTLGEGHLLDVGGGLGHLGYWMEQIQPHIRVLNTDYSFDALKEGSKNYSHKSVNLSADKLPFKEESFDGVIFADVLEHLTPEQAEKALTEAHKVLKPHAHIFINIPNRNSWSNKTFKEPTHLWIPSIKDMITALSLIGFTNIHTSTRGFPFSKTLRPIIKKDIHLPILGTSIFIEATKNP